MSEKFHGADLWLERISKYITPVFGAILLFSSGAAVGFGKYDQAVALLILSGIAFGRWYLSSISRNTRRVTADESR